MKVNNISIINIAYKSNFVDKLYNIWIDKLSLINKSHVWLIIRSQYPCRESNPSTNSWQWGGPTNRIIIAKNARREETKKTIEIEKKKTRIGRRRVGGCLELNWALGERSEYQSFWTGF